MDFLHGRKLTPKLPKPQQKMGLVCIYAENIVVVQMALKNEFQTRKK